MIARLVAFTLWRDTATAFHFNLAFGFDEQRGRRIELPRLARLRWWLAVKNICLDVAPLDCFAEAGLRVAGGDELVADVAVVADLDQFPHDRRIVDFLGVV